MTRTLAAPAAVLLALTVVAAGHAAPDEGQVTVAAPVEDVQDPTTPTGLAGTAAATTAVLTWQPATDDVGVHGYRVHADGEVVAEVARPRAVVTGLTPESENAFTVVAADRAGNTSRPTAPLVLTTREADGGRRPVGVSWDRPRQGGRVRGVLGAGGDCRVVGEGIHHVEFLVDGVRLNTDRRAPWTCVLDTAALANGNHTLTARAFDPLGESVTATTTFTVANVAATTVTPTGTTFDGAMEVPFSGRFNVLTGNKAKAPERVTTGPRAGSYRAGMTLASGQGRAELQPLATSCCTLKLQPGSTWWFADSVWLEPGFPTNTSWQVLAQWKDDGGTTSASPPVHLIVEGTMLKLYGGWGCPSGPNVYRSELVPVVTGQWIDVEVLVHLGTGGVGWFEAWVDGVQKPVGPDGAMRIYPPCGTMYPEPYQKVTTLRLGYYRDTKITTKGVVRHDEYRVAAERVGVSLYPAP